VGQQGKVVLPTGETLALSQRFDLLDDVVARLASGELQQAVSQRLRSRPADRKE